MQSFHFLHFLLIFKCKTEIVLFAMFKNSFECQNCKLKLCYLQTFAILSNFEIVIQDCVICKVVHIYSQ